MKAVQVVGMWAASFSLLAVADEASAQPRGTRANYTPPPAVSPYLNLVRRGTSPAINYYGIVRPELEFRNNIGILRNQVQENRQSISDLRSDLTTVNELPATGHAVYFLNGGHPYFGQAGQSGAVGRSGSAGAIRRPTTPAAPASPAANPPVASVPPVGGGTGAPRSQN
jgi:hypothetical protein